MDTSHYFVDEAGDGTLYDKHGKGLVRTEGCSKFFMLGVVLLRDPKRLAIELEDLRATLLADPYFAGVPSMQPNKKKTAVAFHAKDDLPEVRREVFALLRRKLQQHKSPLRSPPSYTAFSSRNSFCGSNGKS